MIDVRSLSAKSAALRAAHQPGRPLVLANAWDPASARSVAKAGFLVVATASGGVNHANGWRDGNMTPPDAMFGAVAAVARAVDVPVSADLEGGYGLGAGELVEGLLGAGAVGCNLEDTDYASGAGTALKPVDEHAEFLAAVKKAGRSAGIDIVLNARVDVHMRGAGGVDDAIARGRAYRDAGADCVFPIRVFDEGSIAALVDGIGGPINVQAHPGQSLPLPTLARLGVARISYGTYLYWEQTVWLREQLAAIAAEAPV